MYTKLTNECLYDNTFILFKPLNWWITKFFSKYRGNLFNVGDLYKCSKDDLSDKLGTKLSMEWEKELQKLKYGKQPSLLKAIVRVCGVYYGLISFLMVLVMSLLRPAQTICLGFISHYWTKYHQGEDEYNGKWNSLRNCIYYSAVGFCLTTFLNVVLSHPYYMETLRIGMQIRIACCHLIYRKALRLSQAALRQTTVGQIINLLSNDVVRYDWSLFYLSYFIAGPIHALISTAIIGWYFKVGVPSLVGLLIIFLIYVPFQTQMGRWYSKLRTQTSVRTDERVRLMNEIIPAMRVIKMYTWEKPFANLVEKARKLEIAKIKMTAILRGINLALFFVSSKIITFLILILFVIFYDGKLTAEIVFVTIALVDQMRDQMTLHFPYGISTGAEALVSTKRIQTFLLLDEINENLEKIQRQNINEEKIVQQNKGDVIQYKNNFEEEINCLTQPQIVIDNATSAILLKNEETQKGYKKIILDKLSFTVTPGNLTVIVGPCGSGKSSVLLSILGEMPVVNGKIEVRGKITYASQEPWIFAASVRDNILFGNKYDERKYKQVIRVAALERDMEIFPNGDQTMVGDRGTSLSGGQRARINLARALYTNADVYLLDDPLSAVDANVAKHIFEKCIKRYLKSKVVILVTHQLQFVKDAQQIVVLKNGKMLACGDYNHMLRENIDFVKMSGNTELNNEEHNVDPNILERKVSTESTSRFDSIISEFEKPDKETDKQKVEDEELETDTNKVSGMLYWIYIKSGAGPLLVPLLIFANFITQVTFTGGDYWLSLWTNYEERKRIANQSEPEPPSFVITNDRTTNIYIYAGIVMTLFVFSLIRTTTFFTICMSSSIKLHKKLFNSVIRAPISFFDENPIGRILNRCSRDLGIIDDQLPPAAFDFLESMVTCLAVSAICIIINYWNAIAVVALVVVLIFVRNYYIGTARRLKKVEGVAKSPVFSHLSTSVYGLTTIRAFKAEKKFQQEFDQIQDVHTAAWFMILCANRWVGVFLDLICTAYIIITTVLMILSLETKTSSEAALAISQAILINGQFQWGIRQWAELESQMTCVERVNEYSNLPQEIKDENSRKPLKNWPSQGRIIYKNVYLQYKKDEPPVLNNINFEIESGEKIGVVGRTGAGKSSIIATLFRMTQPEGLIIIDNIDTSTITLTELRKKISIIPQEPILFTGPVRRNIDPLNQHTDERLWQVLEKVQLKNDVICLPGKLDEIITEGGGNFSVGQRQLICLARAILKDNKILVLDEATANVDPKTDNLIQQTIREQFADCTVITIAHRLHTIIDSDRVLVLDAGQIIEFDLPYNLLQNPNGTFHEMVETTGKGMNEMLKKIAKVVNETKTKVHDDSSKEIQLQLDSIRDTISSSNNKTKLNE